MPHITVGTCVTWSCWMWLLQFSWLGRNSAWSADGKLQVSLVKFQVCHSCWKQSQALPCHAEMGFSLCLSSCSSKDRQADVDVGKFLWYQSLEVLLVLPVWGNGECLFPVEFRLWDCMLSEAYVAEVSGLQTLAAELPWGQPDPLCSSLSHGVND